MQIGNGVFHVFNVRHTFSLPCFIWIWKFDRITWNIRSLFSLISSASKDIYCKSLWLDAFAYSQQFVITFITPCGTFLPKVNLSWIQHSANKFIELEKMKKRQIHIHFGYFQLVQLFHVQLQLIKFLDIFSTEKENLFSHSLDLSEVFLSRFSSNLFSHLSKILQKKIIL